jgi:hypothetical protein
VRRAHREFVLADEHLLVELVCDTSSLFSDLLEMRACILSHPAAAGKTKHVWPTRQDSIRQAGELQQQHADSAEWIVSEPFYGDDDSLCPDDRSQFRGSSKIL